MEEYTISKKILFHQAEIQPVHILYLAKSQCVRSKAQKHKDNHKIIEFKVRDKVLVQVHGNKKVLSSF